MDGTPTLRMNEFILASLAHNKIDLGPERTVGTGKDLESPKEIKFVLSSQAEAYIKQSEEAFDNLVGAHDLKVNFPTMTSTATICKLASDYRFSITKVMERSSSRSSRYRPMPGLNSSSSWPSTRCLAVPASAMKVHKRANTNSDVRKLFEAQAMKARPGQRLC